jgi:hypothetical protein
VNFFAKNLSIFKKIALPLFALVVLSNSIEQYINLNLEQLMQSPNGMGSLFYFYGFISILCSVIFPVLEIATALFPFSPNHSSKNLTHFLEDNTEQLFIETLRSWGKSLLWALCFIFPGIWKYFEYSLVPFVVTCSQDYQEGKIDALEGSGIIFRRHWIKILGLMGVFHLFIPLVITTLFDPYRLIWKTPMASLALSLLDTYLLIISTQLLFGFIKKEVTSHDTHV